MGSADRDGVKSVHAGVFWVFGDGIYGRDTGRGKLKRYIIPSL